MKFSDTEIRMVEKLRKQQKQLIRYRVFSIIVWISSLISLSTILFMLGTFSQRRFESPDVNERLIAVIVTAFSLPCIFFWGAITSHQLGRTIRNWNGDPAVILLIKLIDDSRPV